MLYIYIYIYILYFTLYTIVDLYVVIYVYIYRGIHIHTTYPEKGLPEEEACLEGVSASRKREFRAGRLCARNALRLLGAECVPIIPSEQRGPTWPEGVIGSISHTREYCAAVVGRQRHGRPGHARQRPDTPAPG